MVSEITATWQQLFEQGKHAYANKDLNNAEELFRSAFEQARYSGATEDALAEMSFNLGVCYHSRQDFFNAEKCYTQALFSAERAYGKNSADVATILRHLGSVYRQTNRMDEAQNVLNRADQIEAQPEAAHASAPNPPQKAFEPPIQQPIMENLGFELPIQQQNMEHQGFELSNQLPAMPQSAQPLAMPQPTFDQPSHQAAMPQPRQQTAMPRSAFPEQVQQPAQSQSSQYGQQPFIQKPASGSTNNRLPRQNRIDQPVPAKEGNTDYDQRVALAARRQPQNYVDVDELVHPREKFYGGFSSAFGWFVYGISGLCLIGLILAPLAMLGSFIVNGIHLGALRSRGIKVSADQFPEVHALIEKYCTLLRMEIPEVYVIQEHGLLNAFANRMHRKDRLVICSDVLELAYKQGERELAFVVVHELTHVKRGHVRWAWLHIPADIIPFLGSAYSRACEYTCDRVATYLVPDGALFGLVALATGTKLYRRVNLRALYDQQEEEWGFWTWYHEIQSTHPNLINRIRAIGIADEFASQSLGHLK
jgi:Zn-dependent protease with chaperone function/tetratricopeptide (TPR) repeat protein